MPKKFHSDITIGLSYDELSSLASLLGQLEDLRPVQADTRFGFHLARNQWHDLEQIRETLFGPKVTFED